MTPNEQQPANETPLEQAGRLNEWNQTAEAETVREEREADMLVSDIGSYVAETDPASLPEAEQQLNAWEIPSDPRDSDGTADHGAPVAVFEARSEGEAAIMRGILESEGIPTMLDGLPTGILGNVFEVGEDRWGDILVPADFADEARRVIASAQPSQEAVAEENISTRQAEG